MKVDRAPAHLETGARAHYKSQYGVPTTDQKVSQYGALCYRRIEDSGELEVLLITTRDTGRWAIPKGRPKGKKKPHHVARQEAWEEAGVRGRAQKGPCGFYRYEKTVDQGGLIPCLVQVHLLEVASLDTDFPEVDERKICWFSTVEAAASVREPELGKLFLKLQGFLELVAGQKA
jgi:8-oxo-dGTP pyrophosphatase MutT (NUDIX family)